MALDPNTVLEAEVDNIENIEPLPVEWNSPVATDLNGNLSTGVTPLKETPVEETTVIDEPIVDAPIINEPVVDEPIEPTSIDTPDNAINVDFTQETKSDKLANEETERKIVAENKVAISTQFDNALKSGASVEELAKIFSANPDSRETFNTLARNHFKNVKNAEFFKKYSGMGNEQMATAVNNAALVVGSDEYKLLSPEQRASFEQYYKESVANRTQEEEDKKFTNDENKIISNNSQEETIASFVWLNVRTASKNLFNTPEITASSASLKDQRNQIDSLNKTIKGIRKDVDKEYPTLSASAKVSVIADRTERLNDSKNTLINGYNAELGNYTRLKGNAEQELSLLKYEDAQNRLTYNTALGLYESRRQEKRADMSAAGKAQADREDMIFKTQNKALAEETQFQRDVALLEYKAKLSDEWVTWEWEERDDGMYFLKSDWTAEKVLNAVTTPWLNANTVFENGQAYTEVYDIDSNWVWFTSQNTSIGAKERELLNAPDWTRIPTRLNKDQLSPNNPWGKECWEYVNDIMASTVWAKIGSKWKDKLSYANESTGAVWSVAVWKVNPNVEDKYWHTGIIVWEGTDKNGNDVWHIKSSNIKGVWIVGRVAVPKTVISGYRSTWVIGKEKVFTNIHKELLDSIETKDLVKKDNKAALASVWLSLKDALSYKAENLTELKKDDYQSALAQIDKMMSAWERDGFSDAIWIFSWERDWNIFGAGARTEWGQPVFDKGTDAADFAANFTALVDALTLPNLDKMTWVLTDKDIALLRNAATGWISMDMSEKEFLKSVESLKGALQKAISWKKVLDGDVIFTDDDGIQYSTETLTQEIADLVEDWKWTTEQAQTFLKNNNINL